MFIALKIVKIFIRIAMTVVVLMLGYLVFQFKIQKADEVSLGPVTVTKSGQSYKLVLETDKKGYLKDAAEKMNEVIYQEAEQHNPPGDVLPDQVDDKIKEKIKGSIN